MFLVPSVLKFIMPCLSVSLFPSIEVETQLHMVQIFNLETDVLWFGKHLLKFSPSNFLFSLTGIHSLGVRILGLDCKSNFILYYILFIIIWILKVFLIYRKITKVVQRFLHTPHPDYFNINIYINKLIAKSKFAIINRKILTHYC